MFEFLAEAIREQSRIREYIEGEAHIKGFLLAYLSMFRYYQLYPEYEMNKGFADFFFKPSPAAHVSIGGEVCESRSVGERDTRACR